MNTRRNNGGGSTTKYLPRRAAAQKATILAAGQLESSPISGSDSEHDGEVAFGEPSPPRGAVRVTYGSKRKTKETRPNPRVDTAVAPESSSSSRPRSLSLVETSPNKPRPNGVRRERSAARNGRTSSRPSRSRPRSHSPSSSIENNALLGTDPDIVLLDEDPALAKRSRSRTVPDVESGLVPTVTSGTTNANGNGPRKRPLSPPSPTQDGNSLASSSSPQSKKKQVFPPTTNIAPRLARQVLRTQSQAQSSTAIESKRQLLGHSKSVDDLFAPLDSTDDEGLDEFEIGEFVWVSIDLQGHLADCAGDESEDTIWWPAKVELPKPMLRVTLFGHPPGMEVDRRLTVDKPSPSNLLPMMVDDRIRFDESNYRPARTDAADSSPRKKRKMDLETSWQEARDLMVRAHADANGEEDDTFSLTSTQYTLSSLGGTKHKSDASGKGKGKGKAVDSYLDDLGLDFSRPARRWRAPSANPLLEIPGELVLAREGKTRTQYWPAKLLEYVKPLKPSQKPKYKVLFFDGTIAQIEEDWFFTTTDDEFVTCKLGEATGNYGLDYDIDSLDDADGAEDFSRPFGPDDEVVLRAPSPIPDMPAPSPRTFEYDFTIPEEFEYIKPVLAAVVDNEYEPARARHEGFMRGGGARRKVLDTVPLRGSLNAKEKEEVAYLVRCWARRRDRRREMGLPVDYPRDKLHPPRLERTAGASPRIHGSDDSALTPTSDLSLDDVDELDAASETEAPPSTFVPTEIGTDDEREGSFRQDSGVDLGGPPNANGVKSRGVHVAASEDTISKNGATEVTEAHDATIAGTARYAPRKSFYDLDALEKITYCNNVLLQEAILQMLLWRTGHRTVLGLLPPKEEQRLHDIAMQEGEKTNWVHDIIRMRQALEKTMLPSSKSRGKGHKSGARGRTRRGAA